ncbi:deleted in lung and esophageal cancer protein 1-like [Felis catus]|uniref:deleted in lung and esophageal cancer protein 1-like n=1 Tax=Felis catus TaxID=9685 RepID=UPI000C2FC75C|nr:deleted in lung and esophageal cancer protein 1-like [Felis catus]
MDISENECLSRQRLLCVLRIRTQAVLGQQARPQPCSRQGVKGGLPAVSPRGPQLLVLTGAGRRAGCGVRGPNTPDRGAGWREAPCRPRPGRGGHGRKEDRSPGGEAAARLRQREATALLTSAQVNVSFSLSLELLSYQKLPADQMLPGVDVRRHANGEKEMVFAQNLLLESADQPAQVVPLKATVAVPELQLSTSWVDFGTCFVNQARVREVYLMNLSGWVVPMGRGTETRAELKSISACPS